MELLKQLEHEQFMNASGLTYKNIGIYKILENQGHIQYKMQFLTYSKIKMGKLHFLH